MRFFDFVSIRLTLCLVAGIILGFYLEINLLIPFVIIFGLHPFAYWAHLKQSRKGFPLFEITFILITVALGVFIINLAQSKSLGNHYSQNDLSNSKLWEVKVRETLKPNSFSHRYVVEVISVEKKGAVGKLLLAIPNDSTSKPLQVDSELYVIAKLQEINPPLNPHQFDYRDYLEKQGIYHQIRIPWKLMVLKTSSSTTFLGLASRFRNHIITKLENHNFQGDEFAVIQALLLGQRDDISEDTYNHYKDAGAIHILAVSGLHVGILLLLFQFLLSPLEKLPKGKTIKLLMVVLLLWIYAFVAGLSPSIVRAVTMFSFVAYAMYLNRPTNSFNIVALSMFFILLVKPLFLFQVGFQMSYAAVLAIVWIYPKLQRFWFPENILIRKVWQLLSVSVAAQLGVLPISLFYFHQFPAFFFVSNLIVIPFLGLILGMGILVIFLALLNAVPSFLVEFYSFIIQTMNAMIAWVAKQESFVIRDIPFDTLQLFLGYFIIIIGVSFLSKPRFKTILALGAGIVLWQSWSIHQHVLSKQKELLLLGHQPRKTVLIHQKADSLQLYISDSSKTPSNIQNYAVAERIRHISSNRIKNFYLIKEKHLYVMDSLDIYPPIKQPDFLLLTQSPKIHLDRLIDSIQPKKIFADGSNYPSYMERWKRSCAKKEIPFHSTSEKGFYVFE